MVETGRCGAIDWAVCATAYPGQLRSGDAFLVQKTGSGVLIAVVDGLGHGDEAADVAEQALASVRKTAEHSLAGSLTACHRALRGSRGVVMTLVSMDADRGTLSWVAIGNVDAAVLRPARGGGPTQRWSVPLRGGVVGDRLPEVRESTAALADGDTFVAATDGMSRSFLEGIDLSQDADRLARDLHTTYARADDDALVLIARPSR